VWELAPHLGVGPRCAVVLSSDVGPDPVDGSRRHLVAMLTGDSPGRTLFWAESITGWEGTSHMMRLA
jgi:hypothetical protein